MNLNRRHFIAGAAAGLNFLATPVMAQSKMKIRYGVASVVFNPDLETAFSKISQAGFAGVEPFRPVIAPYLQDPAALKALLDKYKLDLISVSNSPNGMSTDFINPDVADQTIKDHVSFARDFLKYFGCDHFKISLGPKRTDTPMTPEQLKQIAKTLDSIGKETIGMGIRLAPHPLIGSPLERKSDVDAIMAMTDPHHVWLTADTGHLTLGGIDPVQMIEQYFPRIAEVHIKDVDVQYRNWQGASYRDPTPYRRMGTGGVDFPALFKLLERRGYHGWCSLDLDGTDIKGDTADLAISALPYLKEQLHIDVTQR